MYVYTNPYTCINLLLFLYITLWLFYAEYQFVLISPSLILIKLSHVSFWPPPLDSLWPSTPAVRKLAPTFSLHLFNYSVPDTYVVVFELIAHTSKGNNFIVLCAMPYAFSFIDSTYFQLLESAVFLHPH